MTTVDDALRKFVEMRPRLELAGADVTKAIHEILAPTGTVARLSHRVKEVESYRAKVMFKSYADPWAQVTDKVGVRALVERSSDVDRVHKAIADSGRLEVVNITDKRSGLGTEKLGYSGLHLDLHAPVRDEDRAGAEPVACELQIRTVAQDAWSVVSHKLVYKPPRKLSKKDRRAIMRLCALVELFDEEVDRVSKKSAKRSKVGPASRYSDLASLVTSHYARFASNQGHRELTEATLRAVQGAISEDERSDYPQTLSRYVAENLNALTDLYASYGPESEMSVSSAYLLWSQPESLAILERLDNNHANDLLLHWRACELPDEWLRTLAKISDARIDI